MRKFIVFFFLLFFSLAMSQISFEAIDSTNDCHACPGSLIIKKKHLVDTIQTGSWGKVNSDYFSIKIFKKDYVVLKTSYFGGGILEEGIFIYSAEENNFMNIVFSKLYVTQSSSYENIKGGALKCTQVRKDVKFEFKDDTLMVSIDTTLAFLIEPAEDFIILNSGSKKETYIIK